MKIFDYGKELPPNVIKTEEDQHKKFFCDGHPLFFIPDFCPALCDIWISYMEYIESIYGKIWDQGGGEITSHKIINKFGLTTCTYEAYDISFNEEEDSKDHSIEIEGYVIEKSPNQAFFKATRVTLNK